MTQTHIATSESPASTPSAWRDGGSHARLWLVAAVGLVFDLWTKAWAFGSVGAEETRDFIPNFLVFQRSINPGALFGMGKGMAPIFIGASFFALGFVLFLFITSTKDRRSLHVALGLILAGSLGNLHDRAFVVADKVTDTETGESFIGVVIDEESDERYVKFGAAFDGAHAKKIARDRVEITPMPVVRDFLRFTPTIGGKPVWPWIFNIADALLVSGVILLLINFWLERRWESDGTVVPAAEAES